MLRASVIIPSRNRATILAETLISLSRQTFPAEQMEVVVVDDASVDGTGTLLQNLRAPFPLVLLHLTPSEAFCPARPRNAGLRQARGEVVLFLDADVIPSPDLVAAHVGAHRASPGGSAVIGYTYGFPTDLEGRTPETLRPPAPHELIGALPRLLQENPDWHDGRERLYSVLGRPEEHPAPWQLFWTNNASVPRRLALDAGGFDESFVGWGGEDIEFAYRLHKAGVSFRLAREAWGVHYPHPVGDPAERKTQLERNRRRLLAKHASPQLELWLWAGRDSGWVWGELAPVLRGPCPFASAERATVAALLELGRSDGISSRPTLWCGPASSDLLQSVRPEAWCQPFAGGEVQVGGCTHLSLLGVFTPWEGRAFGTAVAADYWRLLPLPALRGLVRELARVAEQPLLLHSGQDHPGARPELGSIEQCRETLADLLPGWRWREWRTGEAAAFLPAEGSETQPGLRENRGAL